MYTRAIFVIILLSIFSSCSFKENAESLMPAVSGKAFELVLVIEDGYWESEPGKMLTELLKAEVPALPQVEPKFDVVRIPSASFTSIFQQHRNIIYISVSDEVLVDKISAKKNVWAKPQSVVRLEAGTPEGLTKLIRENSNFLVQYFEDAEKSRMKDEYRKYEEIGVGASLRDKHKVSLIVPKGYTLDVNNDNFVWMSHETPHISQGIFIYYYNYIDTATFTKDYLIDMRNSFLKDNVPAFIEGSYMTTEQELPIISKEFTLNKKYAMELRGLWKLNKGFMGGPFVSVTTIDEERNRVVTVEGYVYAPKFEKRNYLNQVEAIISSFSVVQKKDEKAK